MERDQGSSRSLRDWLYILFRHKFKMIAVFFTVVFTVTIVSFLMLPSYRASAKILVKFGRENVYTNTGSSQPLADPAREEQIQSEIEILRARGVAEKVIRNIGVEKIYPEIYSPPGFFSLSNFLPTAPLTPLQKATVQFQKKVRVEGIRKSNIIQVHFEHSDPAVAAQTVNQLIEEFIGQHVTAYKQPQNSNFFDDQTKALNKTLHSSEAKLQDFKNKYNISALPEQKAVLLKQISETELELARVRADISENRGRRESLGAAGSLNGTRFGKETDFNLLAISTMKNTLNALRLREQELRSKYSDQNYLVVAIRKEIEAAERLLAQEEQTYHNKEVTTIDHTLRALEQKESMQRRNLSRYQADIYRINSVESRFRDLERQVRIDEENYQLYAKKAEEGRVSDAMDTQKIANISVVQPALVPIKASKPNIPLNILLSIVLGAFASAGVAYACESLSHTFNTREDVMRYLGLPVLATVGEMNR